MTEFLNRLAQLPPIRWAMRHPRLAAWIALSVGMIVLLLIEVDDAVTPPQLIALMVACVLVAGACIWIISWEDDDDTETSADTPTAEPDAKK
jgi:hypothetical protein